ncbi:MAG TPA: cupin domain-containing protein [Xanthomonadales bacterium]|nr:cupin domain-containing protein [Xanthomonadales bacterium]
MNRQSTGWPLAGMPVEEFLQDYWQKKPCLFRQAFPGFVAELDENDIAGLACEEMVEARLVSGTFEKADWALEQGPFDESRLAVLPERDWCLLVQDVEKHYPPLQNLLEQFAFLPSWRLDDLMVSVSAPGGSVGPHVDQYDVFLLQASGQRRWQVADTFNPALLADSELKVLQEFTAEQEWVLQPGDMLYLPPGVAHFGLALDLGMTWSIGLRAPSQADLFQALGDWLAEYHAEGKRFSDPGLKLPTHAGEISTDALQQFTRLLDVSGTTSGAPDLAGFLAAFISRYRLAHQPASPEPQLRLADIKQALASGAQLRRNPWTRMNWIAGDSQSRLFAAGEEFSCSQPLAVALCGPGIDGINLARLGTDEQNCILLLLNQGHLYLQDPDP